MVDQPPAQLENTSLTGWQNSTKLRRRGQIAVPRYFTVQDANGLLPRLTEILEELFRKTRKVAPLRQELDAATRKARGNGHLPESENAAAALDRLRQEIQADIGQIQALGVEIKDLQQGLVDFPSLRNGEEIYLCWRFGEAEVAYWHDRRSGFSGRQRI